jgi:hypothetical protein
MHSFVNHLRAASDRVRERHSLGPWSRESALVELFATIDHRENQRRVYRQTGVTDPANLRPNHRLIARPGNLRRVSTDEPVDSVDPHGYRSGTRSALFEMAKGTCYYPECATKTTVFVKPGQPSVNVHIAHIEGAEPGSARYRDSMTNEERRSFPNLILLCVPHHDLIDHKAPGDYTVEVLRDWKAARESATGPDLIELNGIREDALGAALEAAVRSARAERAATMEVRSSVLIQNGAGALLAPLGSYPTTSSEVERSVSLTIRSIGELPITVEGISLYWRLNGNPDVESKLMGRDDYVGKNPRTPKVIAGGGSATWMFAIATFGQFHTAFRSQGHEVTHFRFDADLGDGQVLRSDVYEMELIRPSA